MVGVQFGIYSVSAVGFDENKTPAIVYSNILSAPRGKSSSAATGRFTCYEEPKQAGSGPKTFQSAGESISTAKSAR